MKKLFALILTCALLLCGCGLRTVIDVAGEVIATAPELKRVETVTFSLYRVTTEYADGTEEERVYDWNQTPTHAIPVTCTYYKNGEKVGTDTYTSDEHCNILTVTPDYEGGQNRSFSYTYDDKGNVLIEEAFLEGQADYTAEFTYSEGGSLAKKVVTPVKGLRSEYLYDSQGRETERLDYDGDTLATRTVTEYADYGKRAKVTIYDGSGKVTYWEDYSYDRKSSRETALEYSADGELLRELHNYYDTYDQLMRQEAYTPEGTLLYTTYQHVMPHKHIEYVEVTEPTE